MLIFCAAAAVLAFILPMDRTKVRASVTLFLLSIIGLLIASTLPGASDGTNVYYKWTRIVSLFLLSIAIVTLGGIIVFDILLSAVGAKPAVILCELILAISYIAAALLLLTHAGVEVSGVVATSAVVTAAIGLSLQGTLSNVMGGVAIQIDRSITVGDWIKVNDVVGCVKEIRWRQTSIETRNWDTIIIPNSVLMTTHVAVLGRRRKAPVQHRQYVYFHVDYRYPPTDVIAAVNDAVAEDPLPNVAANPSPHCLLMEFKDSYASYAVRYWLTDLWVDEVTDSFIRCLVVFALKRQGITVAIPAYRTFQTDEDMTRRERIVSENLDRRMAAIRYVDLFEALNDEERRRLAQRLHDCPFAAGESMTRQGQESPCMYIIIRGEAEVRLTVEGAGPRVLATLTAGQFFGEMGLLTGDRRAATVVAMTDVTCLRLDKEDFHDFLRERPAIADAISEILVQRLSELDAAREDLTGEAHKERMKKTQGDLLQRIRKFFKLDR
jgi:small-conductance mechanosensitive channel